MTEDLYTEILKSEPPMNLSPDQLSKLIELYATDVVDGMDVRDLCQFAVDSICDNLDGMSEEELRQEITELYDEEYLNNLLQEVVTEG
jgi:hypothetical protein